jgi:hypothetical protein
LLLISIIITPKLTQTATNTTFPALSKASCSNKLGYYLPLNLLIFTSLVIKPGLPGVDLLSCPVWPTLKKGLCFKIKTLIWSRALDRRVVMSIKPSFRTISDLPA